MRRVRGQDESAHINRIMCMKWRRMSHRCRPASIPGSWRRCNAKKWSSLFLLANVYVCDLFSLHV
jgi:hypothetical protein